VLPFVRPAESREESLLLAKQLAAARSDAQKARAASSKLGRQLETEQLLRTDAEGAAEALKQRLERLLDGSKEASKQRTDLAEVRGCVMMGEARCRVRYVKWGWCCVVRFAVWGGSWRRSNGCRRMLRALLRGPGTLEWRCPTVPACCLPCCLSQQLAGATSEVEAFKAERDQLAEVLLEMQVRCTASYTC
jgi:hypothetical protein